MKLCKMGLTAGLVTLGLACAGLCTAGCSAVEDGGLFSSSPITCGGLTDNSDPRAPKTIQSKVLNSFSLTFLDEGLHTPPPGQEDHFPVGRYTLTAQRQGDRAHFSLACDRKETIAPVVFEKDLDASALDELHELLLENKVPAVNGSSLRNTALGTYINLRALYDSGETLSVYAEGGASTVPRDWCGTDVFVKFFLEKLGAKGRLAAPLYSVAYAVSNGETGYYQELELRSDGRLSSSQALFCRRFRSGSGQQEEKQEFPVAREKLEEAERLTDAYGMRGWKNLPFSAETSPNADFHSIALNYTYGEKAVCVDSEMALPPEGREAFTALQEFLEELAKTAPADTESH